MSLSRIAPTLARIVLGAIFVFFGLNFFLKFLASPPMPVQAIPFITGLGAAFYLFPLMKVVEIASGIMLLSNRFVPLALTLLAPIIVNIALFHTFLAPALPLTVVLLAAEIYLAWTYRRAFAPMLAARVQPAGVTEERRSAQALPAE